MGERCWRCWRPKSNCLCSFCKEADTGVKFVILMHPKEAYHQKTGTGRLASLCLKDSEILIGIDFTADRRLCALLADPAYEAVLLYPGDDAYTARSPELKARLQTGRKLLVVVIDATWPLAAKMLRLSTNLHTLPKLSFRSGYRSDFTFKKEPAEDYLSTIESCYHLVKELQEAGIARPCDVEGMQEVFHRMVRHQLEAEARRRAVEGDGPQHPWRHDRDA